MKLSIVPLTALALVVACKDARQPESPPAKAAAGVARDIAAAGPAVRVLAFGDSLFAGYGLKAGEGYPARLEAALRKRGINARIIDAAVSGDTTQAGRQRLSFALDAQERTPDLAMISLGGNDMLRGLPPEQTRANLDAILAEFERRGIAVVLMGMLAAPNLGRDYAEAFNPIYPALAKRHGDELVPFFLQPLMGAPDLIQPDKVHPTAQGVDALVASTVDVVAATADTAARD